MDIGPEAVADVLGIGVAASAGRDFRAAKAVRPRARCRLQRGDTVDVIAMRMRCDDVRDRPPGGGGEDRQTVRRVIGPRIDDGEFARADE